MLQYPKVFVCCFMGLEIKAFPYIIQGFMSCNKLVYYLHAKLKYLLIEYHYIFLHQMSHIASQET